MFFSFLYPPRGSEMTTTTTVSPAVVSTEATTMAAPVSVVVVTVDTEGGHRHTADYHSVYCKNNYNYQESTLDKDTSLPVPNFTSYTDWKEFLLKKLRDMKECAESAESSSRDGPPSLLIPWTVPCPSHDFIMDKIVVDYCSSSAVNDAGLYTVYFEYYVPHCIQDTFLTKFKEIPEQNVPDFIRNVFFTSRTCKECFRLTWASDKICHRCGVYKFWSDAPEEQCCICLDPVYFSKLHCGHKIHRECFVRTSTSDLWFDDSFPSTTSLRCCICREKCSQIDLLAFFSPNNN